MATDIPAGSVLISICNLEVRDMDKDLRSDDAHFCYGLRGSLRKGGIYTKDPIVKRDGSNLLINMGIHGSIGEYERKAIAANIKRFLRTVVKSEAIKRVVLEVHTAKDIGG
jgi:hypothetical protein